MVEWLRPLVDDGTIYLTNNARSVPFAVLLLRKAWLFAGSDRGLSEPVMATLIMTARLNNIDPKAWLADVFPHRRHAAELPARAAAVELDASHIDVLRSGGVAMHVNKVHSVFTISRVAKDLSEDENWLWDVANGMDTEDSVIWFTTSVTTASWRSPTSASKP
ncbi:transposase [Bradyrhizobium vignae]|uniref:Transposase n=1 Tax=Bradyrhizobium vignae TaxID=1549949 RepID=A0A2U3Q9Z6_9BRAD|nr:transposase [Bradyrhizobium vignae]